MCWCMGPMPFSLLGIDDIKCSPPDDKICKGGGVRDVIVFVSSKNMGCTKAPVDEAVNDLDGVLITDTPDIITVSMGEELHTNYVIYGLLGMF